MFLSILVLGLLVFGPAPQQSFSAADPDVVQGDVNCSGVVDTVDSLQILRTTAGLAANADCLLQSGDANCSAAVNSADALAILRHVASLPANAPPGCEAVGEELPGGARGDARRIAIEMLGAVDDEAGYATLLDLMAMLRIGVYTADGGEVQQGAERGPGDFYLYDFELRMMAASLGRGDTSWGVQQIADTLDQVGYREDGQPFTGDNLNQIIHDATNDSLAAPEEESSFVPLLVRELGVRHETSYDLADELDVGDASFDALQMALILWSLTLPVIAEDGPLETPASTLVANSDGILTAQPDGLTDFCSDFKSEGQELWTATKYFLTAVAIVNKVAKAVGVAGFIDLGHGLVLAFSVQVRALPKDVGETHYDHGPGSPGQNLKFRIEVLMLDDLGEILVKCGWLATADFPAQGGIPGVRVQFNAYSSSLEDHGTLDCTGVFCSRMTDLNGIATLTFDPKSETEPYGQGDEWVVGPGTLDAIAWYQSKFKNIFGTVAQFVTPKGDEFTWKVSYHGCPPSSSAPAASAPAAPVEGVPCAYEGVATATHKQLIADITDTISASNLRFELQSADPAYPDGATYKLVRGTVAVEVKGKVGDCTIRGGYSILGPKDAGTPIGTHVFGGWIALDTLESLYAAAGGVADYEDHVFIYCPDAARIPLGDIGHNWVQTTTVMPPIPNRTFTPEDPLQGSYDTADSLPGWTSHFEWHFNPIACKPSPVPVCQ